MQNIWPSTRLLLRDLFCKRPVFAALSGVARRHPSSLARLDPLLKPLASALPDKLLDQISLFAYEPWNVQPSIGVVSKKQQLKLDRTILKVMDEAEMSKETHIHDNNLKFADDIEPEEIFEGSTHRDGSIYTKKWIEWYNMDIADREETSERKTLSTNLDCYPDQENCICHGAYDMIQIFSLSLAKTPINSSFNSGSIQLYGYMAARDDVDGKLNYIFNHSRDDPVIVQQGSLMEMTGPKRAIVMIADLLFEFDIRIKTGEREEDDIQLIDGVIDYDQHMVPFPITVRISGDCGGAVDMSFSLVESAVEAVVQVVISEVQSAFSLSLSSIVSIRERRKEVELFDGEVDEMMGIKRSVLAVPLDTTMHLKLKIGYDSSDAVHYCSFGAKLHGCTNRQIKLEMACITMKVVWSTPYS